MCPRTTARSPNSSACSNPVARWRSRCRAGCPRRCAGSLSDEYHANEGGHIRIYKADALRDKVLAHGLRLTDTHHAHALHAPYWWLKCAVGTEKSDHPAVAAYHKLLVWDMMSRPWLTRTAESVLNPLIGKSVAMYFEKPVVCR